MIYHLNRKITIISTYQNCHCGDEFHICLIFIFHEMIKNIFYVIFDEKNLNEMTRMRFLNTTQKKNIAQFHFFFLWDLNALNILLQLTKNLHHCQNLNENFFRPAKLHEMHIKKGKRKFFFNPMNFPSLFAASPANRSRGRGRTRIKRLDLRCCRYKREIDNGENPKKTFNMMMMIWAQAHL